MPTSVLSPGAAIARAVSTNRSFFLPLRPVIIGPVAGLHRYAVPAEQAALGPYNPAAATGYAYPNQTAGSVIDLAYVKLYAGTASLNYFNKYVGLNGTLTAGAAGAPNQVTASNYAFKTGNGVARSSIFGDRDVQVGDAATVTGTNGSGTTITLNTVVTGFVGVPTASAVGAATGDVNNAATQALSVSVTQVPYTPVNEVVATANAAAYSSLVDGYINRTYTVTVTQSSTGSNATTARLAVTSSDGLDSATGVVPAAFGSATAIGADGLKLTFALSGSYTSGSSVDQVDLVVGQSWTVHVAQAFTAPIATSGGTYAGTKTTTYIATVTRGGLFSAASPPQITVTSTTGYDQSGPTSVTAAATAVALGNYGATVQFSGTYLRAGDVYYVAATAVGAGALSALVFRDSLDASLAGLQVNMSLTATRTGLLIPATVLEPTPNVNWTATQTGITVDAAIAVFDSQFTANGVLFAVPVSAATLYVEYREWLLTGAGTVVELTSQGAVAAALGTVTPDNPLAYAAYLALGNTAGALVANQAATTAASTDITLCVPLGGDPAVQANWQAALDLLDDNDLAYQYVPLTRNPVIQALFVNQINAQSADTAGYYSVVWISQHLVPTAAEVSAATTTDGNPALGTVAATSGTSPTQYTTLTASANVQFVTAGIAPGDQVRINFGQDPFGNQTYTTYTVATVVSQTVLTLVTGPSGPVPVARMFEVWRVYSKAALAAQLTTAAAGYAAGTGRVRLVYPDQPSFGGTVLPGSYLCAALAGLAGSVPSQQGLRNVGFTGFDGMNANFFTSKLKDALAAGGVFVCDELSDGTVYVRNAVTTDVATVATREEAIVRNADMVRKAIQTAWAPYVGSGNVVSNLQPLLTAALASLTAQLIATNNVAGIGPPVATLQLTSFAAVPGAPDKVAITVTPVGIAVPLNQIQITIPVSV